MSVIEDMIAWRKKSGLTLKMISMRSGVSETLLAMVENGGTTHPDIARQIVKAYEFPEECAYELMPKIHRPGDENYDPDAYKRMERVDYGKFVIPPKQADVTDIYIAEHQKMLQKRHAKRGRY